MGYSKKSKKDLDLRGEPTSELIYESDEAQIQKLFEIYRDSHIKARVIYSQNPTLYHKYRVMKFEHENGDFRYVRFYKHVGISKTGIIYKREKVAESIIYKDKKFYYINGKKVLQLTYNTFKSFIMQASNDKGIKEHVIYKHFFEKFGWIRNVSECDTAHHISFNSIVSKKLFNEKALLRHVFKCPYPIALLVKENGAQFFFNHNLLWADIVDRLINIENLRKEMMKDSLFIDTVEMARKLCKKINCSWSLKRLKLEHDNWAREITDIILEFEPLHDLKIARVYRDFAEHSGFELLLTNHQLIAEGRLMQHCVGTYIPSVDNGSSAIFRVGGHTLEVKYSTPYFNGEGGEMARELGVSRILTNNQLRGFKNASPPDGLLEMVNDVIEKFNHMGIGKYENDNPYVSNGDGLFANVEELLPF